MIAIISDIHGNYEALKRVLEKIDGMGISRIYCLGDVVGYYSQINECCEELRNRKVECVMGNHDWYMVSQSVCLRSRCVNDCLRFQKSIITKENLDWLYSFPVIRNVCSVSMVHGGWQNPIDEYTEITEDFVHPMEGDFFAFGHTHVQGIYQCAGKTYCNPGSVGQPRDGDNRAAFAVFDGGHFKLYRVGYDYQRTGMLMKKAGFSDYYYGCLWDGSKRLHALGEEEL